MDISIHFSLIVNKRHFIIQITIQIIESEKKKIEIELFNETWVII